MVCHCGPAWTLRARLGLDAAYLLPRHPSEVDRLDLQHYALRAMINTDHLGPVDGATAILDLGCGTGQRAFELCKEVPAALVVGLDLVPSNPNPPENYGSSGRSQ